MTAGGLNLDLRCQFNFVGFCKLLWAPHRSSARRLCRRCGACASACPGSTMAALRVQQCVCACARSVVSAAGPVGASSRAVARNGLRRRGEVVAWTGVPMRSWTAVRAMSVVADATPVMSASTSTVQAGVSGGADSGAAAAAEYKLVDADVGSNGALDAEESGSDGVTAWFTKRSIQGSTKKLLLLARQVR